MGMEMTAYTRYSEHEAPVCLDGREREGGKRTQAPTGLAPSSAGAGLIPHH